jgi:predicted ester cyclase
MHRDEMLSLFQQHRKAEAVRDFDAIMATFVEDCYLETVALNLRIEGSVQARAAYEGYFTAFPDLAPADEGFAFGEDAVVTWGTLRGTSKGAFVGVPPGRRILCRAVRECSPFPGRSDGGREHLLRSR